MATVFAEMSVLAIFLNICYDAKWEDFKTYPFCVAQVGFEVVVGVVLWVGRKPCVSEIVLEVWNGTILG